MKPPLISRAKHYIQKNLGLFSQSYKQIFFGREFLIPSINGRKAYVSELWMADVITLLLASKIGTFVDVGANLGQTLLKVAAIEPKRPYIGFEPNPTCSDYLFELVRRNNLHHVVIPAGLGSGAGIFNLHMYRHEATDPSASLVEEFRGAPVGTRPVIVVGWKDLPAQLRPQQVAVVKIDVEGGEKEVLEGLIPVLIEQRPAVLLEVLPPHTSRNLSRIERQQEIEAMLLEVGYLIFRINKNKYDGFLGFTRVEEFGIHADLALSDYLLLHCDDANLIAEAHID